MDHAGPYVSLCVSLDCTGVYASLSVSLDHKRVSGPYWTVMDYTHLSVSLWTICISLRLSVYLWTVLDHAGLYASLCISPDSTGPSWTVRVWQTHGDLSFWKKFGQAQMFKVSKQPY